LINLVIESILTGLCCGISESMFKSNNIVVRSGQLQLFNILCIQWDASRLWGVQNVK